MRQLPGVLPAIFGVAGVGVEREAILVAVVVAKARYD